MRSIQLLALSCAAVLGLARADGLRTAHAEEASSPERIVWFGTWEAARAEAKRTGRPLLLSSAMPACGGVPGMW